MNAPQTARWVILLLGFAAYAPALSTGFLYDDHILIESNTAIRSWSLEGLRQDFSTGVFHHSGSGIDFYRPLQILSTRIEYTLWKLHPFPYHLTNLLLHLGNGLLLFELLLALGFETLTALLAGGLFITHPVIVEDLLMVSGRGELLGFFFMLASLVLFLQKGRGALLGSGVAYLLALLSKESAVVAPALAGASLYLKKEPSSRYRRLIPLAAIMMCYLALRHHVLGSIEIGSLHPIRFFIVAFPEVLLRYARILLFPIDLHTDRLLVPPGPHWAAAAGFVAVLLIAIFTRGPRWLRFAALWYLLALLPKTPLMMAGSFMSDHWAYPTWPALALPLAWGLSRAWKSRRPAYRSGRRTAAQALWVALLCAEIGGVYWNVATRNTDEKLYRSALHHTSSPVMKYNLGLVLLRQGRPAEALSYLEQVQGADPTDANVARAVSIARQGVRQGEQHP